jgi:glycosyltransferase involved in cell wall biosynthesis
MTSSLSYKKQISVIVCAHNEGRLLHHTFKSINRAAEYARQNGLETEIIVVADAATDLTNSYLEKFTKRVLQSPYSVHQVNFRDLGKSRNFGIDRAKSDYVSIIDGDDLMSEKWLVGAMAVIEKNHKPVIVHPEYVFSFGAIDQLWPVAASNSNHFYSTGLIEKNLFPSLMATSKKLAQEYPYRLNTPRSGVIHADWAWSCDTAEADVVHLICNETLQAKRHLLAQSNLANELLVRCGFFTTGSHDAKGSVVYSSQLQRDRKVLASSRNLVNSWHGSRLTKRLRRMHPRIDTYATSLRNETMHLLRPQELPANTIIPAWLINEVQALHAIDLRIYFSEHLKKNIDILTTFPGPFSEAYWDTAAKLYGETDILFIVPFLKNGGAEREIAHMINGLLKINPKKRIKILTTDITDSPFVKELDDRVTFVEASQAFHRLSYEEQGRLLACICVQLQPKKVHIVNPSPAYLMLEKFASIIGQNSRIFITFFSLDKTPEGRDTHMFVERLQNSIDSVERVFTDNQTIVDRLVDLMAVENGKFTVIYQPSEVDAIKRTSELITQKFSSKPLKILWAGRIDRQKRLNTLVKIAAAAKRRGLDVEFHVYGSTALNEPIDDLSPALEAPNIHYHGEFSGGLKKLPLNNFDAFILTSEWEGMPNVLLEAIVGGLLVIAPNVGGVKELIHDQSTGFLIDVFDDIEAYLRAIEIALTEPVKVRNMIGNAQEKVTQRHSPEAYLKQLRQQKYYIN